MSPKQHNAKNKNLPWRSKSNFVELYNNRDMTMFEMANEWNCSPHTISVWAEKHEIKTKTLWEICPECLNQKMYDEKNEVHYCPICDNRRTRFKDKLFNLLR